MIPIMRDWQTFIRMYFVYAALESGLLEALQTPCTRESLLDNLDAKRPEILDAILDVGLSVKELSCSNGFYRIRGKRSKLSADGEVALANSVQSGGTDWATANINLTNTTLEGITPLPDLDEILAQLKESGLSRFRTTRFMPGSAFYGIVVRSESIE